MPTASSPVTSWSNIRGDTRDASQDATSVIAIDPAHARARLFEICANQRRDGWFPRAYSASGDSKLRSSDDHVQCGVAELLLDGERIDDRLDQPRLGRSVAAIPIDRLQDGQDIALRVRMGNYPDSSIRGGGGLAR